MDKFFSNVQTNINNILEPIKKIKLDYKNMFFYYKCLLECSDAYITFLNLYRQTYYINTKVREILGIPTINLENTIVDDIVSLTKKNVEITSLFTVDTIELRPTDFQVKVIENNSKEEFFKGINYPLKNLKDKITGILSIGYDITKITKKDESFLNSRQKLEETMKRIDILVNLLPDRVYYADKDGIILDIVYRYPDLMPLTPEQIIGVDVEKIVGLKQGKTIKALIKDSIENQRINNYLLKFFYKNNWIYYDLYIKPINNNVIAISRDITQKRLKEEKVLDLISKLKISNNELEDFIRVVSHDLKAPLKAMKIILGLLLKQYKESLTFDEFSTLKTIELTIDDLSAKTELILENSRKKYHSRLNSNQ